MKSPDLPTVSFLLDGRELPVEGAAGLEHSAVLEVLQLEPHAVGAERGEQRSTPDASLDALASGQDVVAGRMTGGQLSAFVFYAVLLASSGATISELWGEIQRAAAAAEATAGEGGGVSIGGRRDEVTLYWRPDSDGPARMASNSSLAPAEGGGRTKSPRQRGRAR